MIRLKASEITLTPADVEETRRRIERRQAANAPATLPARIRGPPLPPSFRARMKRGPIRARDDSMTSLGHVPILRPQQAVHSSVDDPGDSPRPIRDSLTGSSEAVSSELMSSPFLGEQIIRDPGSTTTGFIVPLPGSELRLPFRSAPQDRESSFVASQGDTSEDTPSPSKPLFDPPKLGRARTNSSEPGNDDALLTRYHASTDGHVDNAASLETSMGARARSLRQRSTHTTSLQRVQRLFSRREGGPTGDGGGWTAGHVQSTNEASSPPPRFIRGYWDSHQRYRFIDWAPRTEPRARTAQPIRRSRAMSTSSEPSNQPRVQRPDTSDSSATGDVFWNTPAPDPPHIRNSDGTQGSTGSSNDRYWSPLGTDGMGYGDPIKSASSRDSSGTSTISQPYSIYELPDSSRHSSNTYSQPEALAQSQYDGAAPSRQVSRGVGRGAYYSIRLPQNRAAPGALSRPPPPSRVPSTSSPDLTALGQHGPSPLPSRPYSRISSAQHRLIPSMGLVSVTDFVGGDQDAASAVQRDLSSPLELIQERANSYFDRISARMQHVSSQTQTAEHRVLHMGDVEEVTNISRVVDRQRRDFGAGSSGHEPRDGTYSRRLRPRMEYAPIPVPAPVADPTVYVRVSQGPRRTVPAAGSDHRAGQRSSENAPVGLSTQESRPLWMPPHRASVLPPPTRSGLDAALRGGELFVPPVMARLSAPQVQRPRDVSNRPHMHSSYPPVLSSDDDPSGSDILTPVPSAAIRLAPPTYQDPSRGPHIPPRHASRHDLPSNASVRQSTRRAVTPIPAPLPFSRQSGRGLPSTSATLDSARGVTSRRTQVAQVARAATRRQIVHEQENSDDRERQEMAAELAGAEWRGGTVGGTDVMDETPPHMGRHERLMY